MEEQENEESALGCMKGLAHFFDLHQYLALRKMKTLAYKRHGDDDKHVGRSKECGTNPDAPSTSQQYEDPYSMVEDKVSIRKHQGKSTKRLSFPNWILREHSKNIKACFPASKLHRTLSIHHRIMNHVSNMNAEIETSHNEQATSDCKGGYTLSSNSDEHNLAKLDKSMGHSNSASLNQTQSDNMSHLSRNLNASEAISSAQEDTNEKELNIMLPPSKEFLAMMKLFNGNIELIHNILDDPSFIFAHYLHVKQASNIEFTRAYSFPVSGRQTERKNDDMIKYKHKRFGSEYLIKQTNMSQSKKLDSRLDIDENDEPMIRTQRLVDLNDHSTKVVLKTKKKEHHRISMDGILHKIPHGEKVLKEMEQNKPCQHDISADVLERKGSSHSRWNKANKYVKKNIIKYHSLNDSIHRYSHLYESITRKESKISHEQIKLKSKNEVDSSAYKMTAKTLRRIFSLPDIKYCLSKNVQRPEKVGSEEPSTEASSKWVANDWEKFSLSEQEQNELYQISKDKKKDLISEENIVFPLHGQRLSVNKDMEEPAEPFAEDEEGSLAFHDYTASEGQRSEYSSRVQTIEIDAARAIPSSDINCFDPSSHIQVDPKNEAKFKYVRDILTRSGYSGSDFLGPWHSPYNPLDPFIFNEVEVLPYEPDITEDEYDILLEHQLLFDLINEVLVGKYSDFYDHFFPWLTQFSTNIRPVPMGGHILEEIWENICWHLNVQPGRNLDGIVARDLTKNDRWMNIQYDIEDVEQDLECLLLDDLLDDLVHQVSKTVDSKAMPC